MESIFFVLIGMIDLVIKCWMLLIRPRNVLLWALFFVISPTLYFLILTINGWFLTKCLREKKWRTRLLRFAGRIVNRASNILDKPLRIALARAYGNAIIVDTIMRDGKELVVIEIRPTKK